MVNKKYNNQPILIQYVDEYNDAITVDSDLVLSKAIQLATKKAYQMNEKEITLELLVHKQAASKLTFIFMCLP
jgi:hypothetical protein